MTKITWKRDYGDGYETDDTVLWVNDKPTQNIVSPCSGCYYIYADGVEIGLADTRKEGRQMILEELGL